MTPDELLALGVARRGADGVVTLGVHAQPGAKKTEAAGVHDGRLKVKLAAPPVDGKANAALLEWVAALYGVSKSRVALVAGDTSRQKSVRISP